MVLIIGELPIGFSGGGPVRNEEILKRFKFDFEFIPSTFNIYHAMIDKNYKERLIEKINNLKLDVPNFILKILESNRHLNKFEIVNEISNYIKRYSYYEVAYSQAEIPEDLILISKIKARHKGLLLQGSWFNENILRDIKIDLTSNPDLKYNKKILINILLNSAKRSLFRNFLLHYIIKQITFVNTINPLNPEFIILINNKKILKNIIFPGNAVENIKKSGHYNKDDYFIYAARANPIKGFLLLPFIWREVVKYKKDLILYVTAEKNLKDPYIRRFIYLIKKFNLDKNIKFIGILNKDRYLEYLSKAKGFILPTLKDTYAISILESLFLGTIVISFDIPTLKYLYNNLEPVILVNNIEDFAKYILKVSSIDYYQYERLFYSHNVREFLKLHESWDNVAKIEEDIILNLI